MKKEKIIAVVKKITGSENIRGEELNIRMFAALSDMIYNLK